VTGDPLLKDLASLPAGFSGTYGVDMEPHPEGLSLTASSPARDGGAPLGPSYSSSVNSVTRPNGAEWDIGAYEFVPALELRGRPGDESIFLDWTLSTTDTVESWHIEYYTQTITAPFTKTDSLSITLATVLTEHVRNYHW
jgi:hypothetical protein